MGVLSSLSNADTAVSYRERDQRQTKGKKEVLKGGQMERYAWKARILPGMREEYCRRHDEIWPEMLEVLKRAGITNYSIWNTGDDLFGYYECTKGAEFAAKVQAESEVVDRWNEYMKDVMVMEMDPVTHAQPLMTEVFRMD